MPSSITLTVSHLPSSTSFFLSALQPLGYVYRGRSHNTIAFGSGGNPSAPADFWITQEIPGVPAGAAHVAFSAPSKSAVQEFILAAIKAGAKVHGEPASRDNSGYYSAAVIDFDGNSIEAVSRPTFSDDKENDLRSLVSRKSSRPPLTTSRSVLSEAVQRGSKSTSAVPGVSRSSYGSASPPGSGRPSGDLLDNLFDSARTAANVARQVADNARSGTDRSAATTTGIKPGNGEGIVGALLGVAAGAALYHAFSERRPSVAKRSYTEPSTAERDYPRHRAIEGPSADYDRRRPITMEDNDYASTVKTGSVARTQCRERESGAITSSRQLGSTTSKSSRTSGQRAIEAPPPRTSPPTSYRPFATLTPPTSAPAASSSPRSSRRRSVSADSGSRRSSHSRSQPHRDVPSFVRVEETLELVRYNKDKTRSNIGSDSDASTIKPTSRPTRPPSSASRSRRDDPEFIPLPPSRASTWAGSFHDSRSQRLSRSRQMSTSKAKESSSGGRPTLTKSMVGKIKDTSRLGVSDDAVRPEDSVSQVSSVRSRVRR